MSDIGLAIAEQALGLAAGAGTGNTTGQRVGRLTAAAGLRANTPAIPADTPSVSFSGTTTFGANGWRYTWDNANSRPNPEIGFLDYPRSAIYRYGPNSPQNVIASTGRGLMSGVNYFGSACDLPFYGNGFGSSIWIDGVFFGNFQPAYRTGTAQAGASGTITLDSGASATNGLYNEYYVVITGGTGTLGEVRRITGYIGSTKVATVTPNWTVAPDSSTTFAICENERGIYLDGITGSVKYLHLTWSKPRKTNIMVFGANLIGFLIGPNDTISPAAAPSGVPLLVPGDSFFDGSANPRSEPALSHQLADHLGCNLINDSEGSTGWATPATGSQVGGTNRLNFRDRICPPAEAWRVSNILGLSAGTFTVTVTTSAGTQTTGGLAYNASNTTIENALNALSNVTAIAGGNFAVVRGDTGTPRVFLARNLPGATISFDSTGLTGGTVTILGQYLGDVEAFRPKDAGGNSLPFILFVPGSGNDSGRSDAEVQAASIGLATDILAKIASGQWAGCIPIFTGVVGDAQSASDTITSGMVARNTAYKAGALLLPKINGQVPFIDTYDAGVGGKVWLYGSGTVGAPSSDNRSFLKSITNTGHPTGRGAGFEASMLGARVSALLRGGAIWPA